jgi:hypothetical protein
MLRGVVVLMMVGALGGCGKEASKGSRRRNAPPSDQDVAAAVGKAVPGVTAVMVIYGTTKYLEAGIFESDVWAAKTSPGDMAFKYRCKMRRNEFRNWAAECDALEMKLRRFIPGLATMDGRGLF